MSLLPTCRFSVWCSSLVLLLAAGITASASERKTEIAATFEQSYDSNVLRLGRGPHADVDSWVSAGTLRVAHTPFAGASMSYTGIGTWFSDASSENNNRHALALADKGSAGALAWEGTAQLIYVNGSHFAPNYDSGHSLYASIVARERREQWQERATLSVRYDAAAGFARVVGAYTGFDHRSQPTTRRNTDNYVDRYDAGGGFDLGRALRGQASVWVGYRYGRQEQDRDGFRPSDRSNRYDRVLLGFEGAPTPWLKVAAQAGPAAHRYQAGSVGERTVNRLFVDFAATAKLSAADSLQLSAKRQQVVSSVGLASIDDVAYAATWKRQVTKPVSLVLGGKAFAGLYDGVVRRDWYYAGSLGLTWRQNARCEWTLGYLRELGRDRSILDDPEREFGRHLFTLGLTWSR